MQVHPAAELFPMLAPDELEALAADIGLNGLREPIVLDTDGRILDGRNRARACDMASVTPAYRVYEGSDPVAFVISANLRRRHLSAEQRAIVAAELATMQQGARTDLAPIGAMSQAEAANLLNVSRRSVQRARKVLDHAEPEVVEAVKRGELAVSRAATIAKEEPETQREILSRPAHVSHNSGQSEWYTPETYIAAARAVMGGIDLDPASCPAANEVVGAARYFTEADNGLEQEWTGRVFLNPPYSQPLIEWFTSKLADEFAAGDVTEACVLVNNATETVWFQTIAAAASCVCFPRGRVRFWHPERESAPLQGQAVLYLGPNVGGFQDAFAGFGFVGALV